MNNRERCLAILNYQRYDRMPVLHFGFWQETLDLWSTQGHISKEEALGSGGCEYNPNMASISNMLGFDCLWTNFHVCPSIYLSPGLDPVVETLPDGSRKVRDAAGVTVIEKEGDNVGPAIHAEEDHLLKDRASYEEFYKPRLRPEGRVTPALVDQWLEKPFADVPAALHLGSMVGYLRCLTGVPGLAYLAADDEDLFREIANDYSTLIYEVARQVLELASAKGLPFDYGMFWEDICCKSGPLVTPSLFHEVYAPHYKRVTELLKSFGIKLTYLDCDGCIDTLIPTWVENDVNIMFPIEVGTWNASIAPWREKYGRELRGVGGMDKNVFARDKSAVDSEIERLKPLIALGGYIPCPDHLIAPDAKWELVQYYCEQMRRIS